MRFVMIKDASSDEHQRRSAASIAKVLEKIGDVEIVDFGRETFNLLRHGDLVFNLAVGKRHDFLQGTVASALEAFGIPFIGSPAYTHYVCLDKFTTKTILNACKIPVPEGCVFDGKRFSSEIPAPPLMVKPAAEGSGIGIDSKSLCADEKSAADLAGDLFERFGEPVLVERYVEGTELTVALVGDPEEPTILPAVEVDFSKLPLGVERYYSFDVKEKHAGSTIYRCPPSVGEPLLEKVKELSIETFRAVRARDYIRIDFRINEKTPYVIDVNSMPGLDPVTSDIPKMLEPISKDYEWLVLKIIGRAVRGMEAGDGG